MFVDELKKQIEEGRSMINIKNQIFGVNYGSLNITSLNGNPITLGTPFENLKFRFQIIASGAVFSEGNYRLDNSHGFLHQHSGSLVSPISFPTISGAFFHILGADYYNLEKNETRNSQF